MKNKILLTLLLFIAGCGYAPMDSYNRSIVITEIKEGNGSCYYYGYGNKNAVATVAEWNFKFIDTCGKFQIGDTITFKLK